METVNAIDMTKVRNGYVWDGVFGISNPKKPALIYMTYRTGHCLALVENCIQDDGKFIQLYRNYELLPVEQPKQMRQMPIGEIVEQNIRRKNEKGYGWGYINRQSSDTNSYFSEIFHSDNPEDFFWFILEDGQKLAYVKRNKYEVEV